MSKAKSNLPIRTVIFKFKSTIQADKFFGAFSDVGIKDIQRAEEVKKAVDVLMGHCNISSVHTKQDPEYGAAFIECNL